MKKLSHKNAVYLNSEALKMINYDRAEHILEATFNNDKTYQYKNIPEDVWMEFLTVIRTGKSAGAFINQQIKPFYTGTEIS